MPMACLYFADAQRLSLAGKPWCFRYVYHDAASNSHKFWLATGRGRNEVCEIHFGRIGAKAQILIKDWDYVATKAPEKEAKGYDAENTPYIRVRQSTIDASFGPTYTTSPLPPATPVTPATPPAAAQVGSTNDPYNRVVQVCPTTNGQWIAVDASGVQLFAMPKAGAMKLVQDGTATVGGL